MRTRQQVTTTHHFRNTRECVVHRYRQLICKNTVCSSYYKIAAIFLQVATLLAIIAIHKIRLLVWDDDTLSGTADFEHCGVLLRREAATSASIYRRTIGSVRRRRRPEVGTAAKTIVNQPLFLEFVESLQIYLRPLRLIQYLAIAIKPEPMQIVDNLLGKRPWTPHRVQIFYPDNPPPALPTRIQPRHQRGIHVAKGHPSRRRRRKTAYSLSVGHNIIDVRVQR